MEEIDWQPKARKQLKKIKDRSVQKRIAKAVDGLEGFPQVSNIEGAGQSNRDRLYRRGEKVR